MEASAASSTATSVSLMRAVCARTARHPILNDPWGEFLLPGKTGEIIQQKMSSAPAQTFAPANTDDSVAEVGASVLSHPALVDVIVRSRYTEDAPQAVMSGGVKQYVQIGAGLGSYSLRVTAAARHMAIYEKEASCTLDLSDWE